MAGKIHLLRPDSITPIHRYLDRLDSGAASPVEFACPLLYREREYRAMYASSWRPDRLPSAGEPGPFAPYGLTRAAADLIAATIRGLWGVEKTSDRLPPEDLFGLKADALSRLRAS